MALETQFGAFKDALNKMIGMHKDLYDRSIEPAVQELHYGLLKALHDLALGLVNEVSRAQLTSTGGGAAVSTEAVAVAPPALTPTVAPVPASAFTQPLPGTAGTDTALPIMVQQPPATPAPTPGPGVMTPL